MKDAVVDHITDADDEALSLSDMQHYYFLVLEEQAKLVYPGSHKEEGVRSPAHLCS